MRINIVLVLALLAALFVVNMGFNLQLVSAYDPWAQVQRWQSYNPGGLGWGGGSPMSGPGFNRYGYNYFNPYAGPSMPLNSYRGTLSYYDYSKGYPGAPGTGGWDGYLYGSPQWGSYGLYGIYGYNNGGIGRFPN